MICSLRTFTGHEGARQTGTGPRKAAGQGTLGEESKALYCYLSSNENKGNDDTVQWAWKGVFFFFRKWSSIVGGGGPSPKFP